MPAKSKEEIEGARRKRQETCLLERAVHAYLGLQPNCLS